MSSSGSDWPATVHLCTVVRGSRVDRPLGGVSGSVQPLGEVRGYVAITAAPPAPRGPQKPVQGGWGPLCMAKPLSAALKPFGGRESGPAVVRAERGGSRL